jgi:cation:H+ antiporter
MIILNLTLFLIFLFGLIKCAEYSMKYSSRIARNFHIPEFAVSFFIIAIISVLPEATISIISAFKGQPELGLGTLLGSNVADLTLVFGVVALFSKQGIKVQSKILSNNFLYMILLLFPLLLGFDGKFSRVDGLILILVGLIFFARIYSESRRFHEDKKSKEEYFLKNLFLLILSLSILLLSAFLTVKYAVIFANEIKVPAVIIGVTILALGTCLPELTFSIKAVRKNHDELALGDLLGTVITDATIILGIVALICPFSYSPSTIYLTGTAMFLSGALVTALMKSDKTIKKTEGIILILAYLLFILAELLAKKIISI